VCVCVCVCVRVCVCVPAHVCVRKSSILIACPVSHSLSGSIPQLQHYTQNQSLSLSGVSLSLPSLPPSLPPSFPLSPSLPPSLSSSFPLPHSLTPSLSLSCTHAHTHRANNVPERQGQSTNSCDTKISN